MNRDRIILAGGSGFLGQSLARELISRRHEVVVLTRQRARIEGDINYVSWDGKSVGAWNQWLERARAVVNLTGRTVNCRHTPAHQREIVESRVNSVKAVGEAIRGCARPPAVWVQASSLAIYGDAGERVCDESAPRAEDFPAQTCVLWEKAFDEALIPTVRGVALRIGFVLARDLGALKVLERLTRLFAGGTVSSGRQYMSWIHIADMNRMFVDAIERPEIRGAYNATSPHPITNREFMRELRKVLHRPWSPPVPAWAAHVGSWLMRTEASLALTGRRCVPSRFSEQGFSFQFPDLRDALANLYGAGKES